MARGKKPFKKLTPMLAIIAKCRQCSITAKSVKECNCKSCALYSFRLGKQPDKPANALDIRVFDDVPESVVFKVRSGDKGDDDLIITRKEIPAYEE